MCCGQTACASLQGQRAPAGHPTAACCLQTVKMGVQYSLWGGSVVNLGTERHRKQYFDDIDKFKIPGEGSGCCAVLHADRRCLCALPERGAHWGRRRHPLAWPEACRSGRAAAWCVCNVLRQSPIWAAGCSVCCVTEALRLQGVSA